MAPLIAAIVPKLAETVMDAGKTLIDRIWPDKVAQAAERQRAELELFKLTQVERMQDKANELTAIVGQLEINKIEAGSDKVFVAGWRPFIGWVCGVSFAYVYLVGPIITQVSGAYGYSFPLPPINTGDMMTVLLGMLGLGGLRTFEKVKGITK